MERKSRLRNSQAIQKYSRSASRHEPRRRFLNYSFLILKYNFLILKHLFFFLKYPFLLLKNSSLFLKSRLCLLRCAKMSPFLPSVATFLSSVLPFCSSQLTFLAFAPTFLSAERPFCLSVVPFLSAELPERLTDAAVQASRPAKLSSVGTAQVCYNFSAIFPLPGFFISDLKSERIFSLRLKASTDNIFKN